MYAFIGSVWIRLILLKLKTYCWNHCSKIIFKCVNNTVGPIFNEKVAKKWNLWVHKQYMMHCLLQKSQHLRLLFIEQYMNSNHVLPKRVKKKKKKNKKQKRNTQTWVQNVDPNIHLEPKLHCDVGHRLIFKLCNYLILIFLCNFCYFRFRLFISFFLCDFNVV